MLQAVVDENNIVVGVNYWDPGVGIPCDESTQLGMLWNGTSFVRNPNDIILELELTVEDHLDNQVKSKNYRSIESCCSYYSSSNSRYAADASNVIAWRDAVWEHYTQVINDYKNNLRSAPTPEELIAELPPLNW